MRIKKNNKGFTLIELLVVVAIIGILAAVGVTAYSGYTESAQRQSAKTNHATIAKYINAEVKKCILEGNAATVMSDNLTCADRSDADAVSGAVALALADFSNPFDTTVAAISTEQAEDCATDTEGITYVDNSTGGEVTITTCWNNEDELQMTNTFEIE